MDITLTLTGNLGAEVESRQTKNGMPVASFNVATTPRLRRGDGWIDGATTWTRVDVFWDLAEHCAHSLHKGDPVIVHGRLRTQTWTGTDNAEHTRQVLEATAVGHDLTWGTSQFQRQSRQTGGTMPAGQPITWQESGRSAGEMPPTPLTPSSAASPDPYDERPAA
jgi:single-strand DNA-binding protein